jgi:ribonuclease HII
LRGDAIVGLDDSKKLSPRARERLFDALMASDAVVAFSVVGPGTIDRVNILNATLISFARAIGRLRLRPRVCMVDGNRLPCVENMPMEAVIRGDSLHACISAASIIAKVTRDRIMQGFDLRYPGYDFSRHKGYGTLAHYDAIRRLGVTPQHRRSFTLYK